ncbi:MAG TPA: VOC family protein [Candidatus Paceibacterota bacterium]|nr:VOC family protein [Candidatus Paceibacterota bacterium]
MQTKLNPYINFDNKAKEALEFYKSVFGGTLTMSTYKEGGMATEGPDVDKIMHGMLVAENGITLMASDAPSHMVKDIGSMISISLSGDNEEELQGYWDKLSDGGTQTVPYEKAPWGDKFGMLADKFGINWMVNCAPKK